MPPHDSRIAPRLDFDTSAPLVAKALAHLDNAVTRQLDEVAFAPGLRDLLRVRASQLNGCAYCVDMHTKDARGGGESEDRLSGLVVWRETSFYSPAEHAALALTESITTMSLDHVPPEVFEEAAEHYSPPELGALIGLVIAINAWNAVGVSTRCWEPGTYQPA